ncbi:hypothetical protein [uncultured Rikenella sp.]|uniref:hypothetical protein n=1 Tax=uncultured Rikenella sp. TaxID=368003 RepID=UPI002631A1B1|nr:hypothetical protein [uncultured Rikenella sp.]
MSRAGAIHSVSARAETVESPLKAAARELTLFESPAAILAGLAHRQSAEYAPLNGRATCRALNRLELPLFGKSGTKNF